MAIELTEFLDYGVKIAQNAVHHESMLSLRGFGDNHLLDRRRLSRDREPLSQAEIGDQRPPNLHQRIPPFGLTAAFHFHAPRDVGQWKDERTVSHVDQKTFDDEIGR